LSPRREARLEGIGVDQQEHPPERIMRGNAVGQGRKSAQPGLLAAPIERDVLPTFRASDHCADRDHQDVDQTVLDLARAAGIVQDRQMLNQLFNQREGPLYGKEVSLPHAGIVGSLSFHA
jgi:hypothetical protein